MWMRVSLVIGTGLIYVYLQTLPSRLPWTQRSRSRCRGAAFAGLRFVVRSDSRLEGRLAVEC